MGIVGTSRSAASAVHTLVRAVMGSELPLRISCWDGSVAGPPDAAVRLVIRHRRALRRLLWAPNELGLARAFVSGDLDVETDFFDSLAQLERVIGAHSGPLIIDASLKREFLKEMARLGALG